MTWNKKSSQRKEENLSSKFQIESITHENHKHYAVGGKKKDWLIIKNQMKELTLHAIKISYASLNT